MPIKKRRLYLLFFSVVFISLIPALLLYTSGYRIDSKLNLFKTGGIFISVPTSGAEVYINNKLLKTTNLIQRDVFEQDLKPETYFVFVYKEGYWPWSKELKVHEQLVVDAHAFLIPKEPNLGEIPKIIPDEKNPGKSVPNPFYREVVNMFDTEVLANNKDLPLYSESANATSTITRNKVTLKRTGNNISATWLGEKEDAPSSFCDEYKKECSKEISVFSSSSKIKTFDFYPGRNDVLIISRKNGIYAVETDTRKIQNFALIYAGGDPDFRIGNDGGVYIKDGSNLYKIAL